MFTDGLTDDEKLRLATYGSIADMWKVEAYFAHIDGPVVYLTNGDDMDGKKPQPKRDAYRQVADWLMSENIQGIQVYKNGVLYQRITVDGEEDFKWDATIASPEGQRALKNLAEQARREIEAGEYEEGGFGGPEGDKD